MCLLFIHPMENAIILLAYVVYSTINQLPLFIQKRPVQASVTYHLLHYLFHCTDKSIKDRRVLYTPSYFFTKPNVYKI